MAQNIRVYGLDDKGDAVADGALNRIAASCWGHDENKLDTWINNTKSNSYFGFPAFYIFAMKNKLTGDVKLAWDLKDDKIIGFAYVCQDENNESHWFYGELITPKDYRPGISFKIFQNYIHIGGMAQSMIDFATLELHLKKASKLFTYIDKNNKSSILLHEKLSFVPSENQESINGFDKDGKVVYERML